MGFCYGLNFRNLNKSDEDEEKETKKDTSKSIPSRQ